ncbi:hypothetical protein F5X68DRAFT_268156 [Plectosphaerella plurivora]|uniref:Uncharacterized protein n=1 Tax=Plectosphaerella plurivora TaxID=936078 RepID=A0A9P9ADP2_9PEZI|nr:hypothetical protein F5X68DRAFT_268156 [Plectosphaerella plurivora]
MPSLVWLITGATSGIGASLVEQVVARGDKVIASGRKVQERLGHLKLEGLEFLELDITSSAEDIRFQAGKAWDIFGHVDVVMNNAGMSAMKSAEEADEQFINNMFQVNFFGQLRVTQAFLPLLREQGHGCIAFTSSSVLWAPLPFMSHYAASKAALSTYVESLDKETRGLGIRFVAFECGGFPTNLGQPRDSSQAAFGSLGPSISAYAPLFGALMSKFATNPMVHMPGDVGKAAVAIVDVVKREGLAAGKPWAVRVALGSDGLGSAKQRSEEQIALGKRWGSLSTSTDREVSHGPGANEEMFELTTVLEAEE